MLWELRQYRAKPGQRENLVRWMEDEVIPFQTSKGMVIAGSFTAEKEDDLYVWIRRFDDEEHRKALYAAVYGSDEWKNVIGTKAPDLLELDQMVVTRLNPTPLSVLR